MTPEDAAAVEGLPESVTVLRQPIRNIYLVSTSVMDTFLALDGLDSVTLSGTQAEGWYLDEARAAMEDGRIAYAGKYSAPTTKRSLRPTAVLPSRTPRSTTPRRSRSSWNGSASRCW